jgi:hypothetical protein
MVNSRKFRSMCVCTRFFSDSSLSSSLLFSSPICTISYDCINVRTYVHALDKKSSLNESLTTGHPRETGPAVREWPQRPDCQSPGRAQRPAACVDSGGRESARRISESPFHFHTSPLWTTTLAVKRERPIQRPRQQNNASAAIGEKN